MPPSRAVAALAAAALLGTGSARADGPRPIRWDPTLDLSLTGAAVALWVGTELAKGHLAPARCRFCGTNALDAGARDLLVWGHDARARRASDAIAFGVLPAALATHALLAARAAGAWREGLVDVLVVAEAAALAADLDQIVKFAVGRQRPFVRYGNWAEPDRAPDPDDNLSFYSGHTTLAFALAASAGTVAQLRGYRGAPWVWGAGLGLATAVGWLRIAGDKHYLSDVLVGAATGAAIGVALPRLLHGREREGAPSGASVALVPVPLGVRVTF